ncbi:MAG TPA: N-acetylmuramoyl-L-alanine amidase [Candidatus Hydrogenedentes bacterium]|nr:N-acetylmuramoyl-L-alanine amidase [Candidatus Hydrogenedentota bacterium]HOV75753.1 N-acetylmuramoyl-L-alanine amidase [Candidatus Hydrogenedentota bacterium]HPC16037.1 N-acetylmuramoyl-L-alanine amidase [Candidatus Hydrogenedentota bacterium]HRT19991.1 N-acetylmuramoyl-L-alanine amidase [Candidatus Hydrogenedentota bacterium]HRT64669.1 N-acetylmuramoyl-L-alanine amidase [Candidatus Hydrogenedentota bacterium]
MRPFPAIALFGVVAVAWCPAWGELASFSVRVQDDLRVADVELVPMGDTPYVSLSSLASQMGGACRVTPERVQVDLAAKAAWLSLGTAQVSSSLGLFDLAHPVQERNGEALIALEDVVPLFRKAFNLAIKQDLPVQPPAPAPSPELPPSADPVSEPAPVSPPVQPIETPPEAPLPSAPVEPPKMPASDRAKDRPVQIVILDPGHGGSDSGCEGHGGLQEKQAVFHIALKTSKALAGAPVTVLLTRDSDKDVSRAERTAFANQNKGDLYISIHLGSGLSQSGRGIEAFYWDPDQGHVPNADGKITERPGAPYAERSLAAAKALADAVAAASGQEVRGVHPSPCALLGDIGMPGVLLEAGYLGNPAEESLLLTEDHQAKIANGIAEGIKALAAPAAEGKP